MDGPPLALGQLETIAVYSLSPAARSSTTASTPSSTVAAAPTPVRRRLHRSRSSVQPPALPPAAIDPPPASAVTVGLLSGEPHLPGDDEVPVPPPTRTWRHRSLSRASVLSTASERTIGSVRSSSSADTVPAVHLTHPSHLSSALQDEITPNAGGVAGSTASGSIRTVRKGEEEPWRRDAEERDEMTRRSGRKKREEQREKMRVALRDSFIALYAAPDNQEDDRGEEKDVKGKKRAPSAQQDELMWLSAAEEGTMHPTFDLPSPDSLPSASTSTCKQLPRTTLRVRIKVFSRPTATIPKRDGKEDEFGCDLAWDVDFSSLVPLGKDPVAFPELKPNSLLFWFGSKRGWYTAGERVWDYDDTDDMSLSEEEDQEQGSDRSPVVVMPSSTRSEATSDTESLDEAPTPKPNGAASLALSAGAEAHKPVAVAKKARPPRALPGAPALTPVQQRKAELATALQLSKVETKMKSSLSREGIVRLSTLCHVLADTKGEMEGIREAVGAVLEPVEEGAEVFVDALLRERNYLQEEVGETLRRSADESTSERGELAARLEERREALAARRERLYQARTKMLGLDLALSPAATPLEEVPPSTLPDELEEVKCDISAKRASLELTRRKLLARRRQLATLLADIFPIAPLPSGDSLQFSILSLPLANSSATAPARATKSAPSSDPAAPLGYVAQVVHLLADYLGAPLLYPIKPCGSRTLVSDLISRMKSPVRAFPLWREGVEGYRFEYAWFLLNKDIELMMIHQNVICVDLRCTLPNLKALLLTLELAQDQAADLFILPPLTSTSLNTIAVTEPLSTASKSLSGPGGGTFWAGLAPGANGTALGKQETAIAPEERRTIFVAE